jgi:hypothetical protein
VDETSAVSVVGAREVEEPSPVDVEPGELQGKQLMRKNALE